MAPSKILIVEYDEPHATKLKSLLEAEGHIVMGPAPTCSSALELIWRERPDLAFVVTHLGSETCEAVLDECDLQDVSVIVTIEGSKQLPAFIGDRIRLDKPVQQAAVLVALSSL